MPDAPPKWNWCLAWVDGPDVVFDPDVHIPGDESVINVDGTHVENQPLKFTCEVERFDEGPINPDRKRWAMLIRETAAGGSYIHKATGRMVGVPTSSSDSELISISFECMATNWLDRKLTALAPIKAGPTYDPLLIGAAALNDPAEILDGYAGTVEFDPVTHNASVVDLFGVGAAVITIPPDDVDRIGYENTGAPLKGVQIVLPAEWTQVRKGNTPLGDAITEAFGGAVETLTPDEFEAKWPKPGDSVNGSSGYTFKTALLAETALTLVGPFHGSTDIYNYINDPNLTAPIARDVYLQKVGYSGDLSVDWKNQLWRKETFNLFVPCEGQDIALGTGEIKTLLIQLQNVAADDSLRIWLPVTHFSAGDRTMIAGRVWVSDDHVSAATWAADTPHWTELDGDESPLGGRDTDSFFPLPRGKQVISAAVFRARAMIADSLRNGEVTIDTPLTDDILMITPAKQVAVTAEKRDMPSGSAQAKVYSFHFSSRDGLDSATTVLRGGTGKGTARAMGGNYVTQTGQTWDAIRWNDFDDQIALGMPSGGLEEIVVTNTAADQSAYIALHDYAPLDPDPDRHDKDLSDPVKLLKDVPTTVEFRFINLGGQNQVEHNITTTCIYGFAGPRQIDFEASA